MKRVRPADMTEMYALRADTIDYFFPERDDEVESWAKIASEYGDDVLHLMCGTGEILVGLAKKGFNVTGIDLTESMIYQAEENLEDEGIENFDLIVEDARSFKVGKKFDFIFISTGDFHHFLEQEDINLVLGRIFAHLRPGGAVAIELFQPNDQDFKRPEKRYRPFRETPPGLKVWKVNRSSYHADSQILEIVERLHVEEEGEIVEGEYDIQLQLHTEEQIEHMLKDAGFEDVKHLHKDDLVGEHDSWIVLAKR